MTTQTRLAIEAALAETVKANWSTYSDATSDINMRQLLQEHDTEVAQLKAGLAAANTNAEKFEREWYLRGDELEDEKELVRVLRETVEFSMSTSAHGIPSYAYSESEAGSDLAHRLSVIYDDAQEALTQTQPKDKQNDQD